MTALILKCKNDHSLDSSLDVSFQHIVGRCLCGNLFVDEFVMIRYFGDIIQGNYLFHLYKRTEPILCGSCERILTDIRMECCPKDEYEAAYHIAKERNFMPSAFMRN